MQTPYVRDFDAEITSSGKVKGQKELCRPEFFLLNGREMCRIVTPGDKNSQFVAIVDESIKRRFAAQYLSFTKGDVAAIDGTPLANLSTLPASVALQMQAVGIRTIEELANLPDGTIKTFMGGLGFREKARAYLENNPAKDDETEALKAQVAALTAMVEKFMGQTAGPTEPVRQKPGPKPKEQAA